MTRVVRAGGRAEPAGGFMAVVPSVRRACDCGKSGVGKSGVGKSGGGTCASCAEKKRTLRRQADGPGPAAAPGIVHDALHGPGAPLDRSVRTALEPAFGRDLSRIRVHTDPIAQRSAAAVEAQAYTVGQHIVFAAGRYAPATAAGRRLIAHEAAHALQQGPLSGPPPAALPVGPANDAAEREADDAADAALSGATMGVRAGGTLRLRRKCSDNADIAHYRARSDYCQDSPATGHLHPGQTCFRQVPKRSGYFDCPPGDQVCFDAAGTCHDSWDEASPVEKREADGTCNLHAYCSLHHAHKDKVVQYWFDLKVAPLLEPAGRAQMECLKTCQSVPVLLQGACMAGCSPRGM